MLKSQSIKQWITFLKSPLAILLGIILGGLIGAMLPILVPPLAWVGDAYLSFLKLCALPIMLSAIVGGTYRLLGEKDSNSIIIRLLFAVFAGFILCNLVAIGIGWVAQSSEIDPATLASLGTEVNKTGIDYQLFVFKAPPPTETADLGLGALLNNLISDNIFSSLSEGQTLEVLTFAILFGIALSLLPKTPIRGNFTDVLDFMFQAFNNIVKSSLAFLPLALLGLIGKQVASTGIGTIQLMLKFVILANLCFAIAYVLSVTIVWFQAKRPSFKRLLSSMKETSVLAVTTSNSFACLPSSLTMMKELGFNEEKVNSLLPINLITFRYGTSVYFVLATMFVLNVYQEPFGVSTFLTVLLGCILASLSSLGLVGIATLSCIEVVCRPLGLPVEAVLLIFVAIDPLVNPLRALVNVYASMMVTSLITDNHNRSAQVQPHLAPVTVTSPSRGNA
jgi:Na+/H+-dicarboxylate symporter